MKKIIFGAMVAAAAVFGAYTASQTSEVASLNLLSSNIEAWADGGDGSSASSSLYMPYASSPVLTGTRVVTYTYNTTNSNGNTNSNTQNGNIGFKAVGGGVSHTGSSSSTQTDGTTVTVTETVNEYTLPCVGSSGNSCTPQKF